MIHQVGAVDFTSAFGAIRTGLASRVRGQGPLFTHQRHWRPQTHFVGLAPELLHMLSLDR